MQDTNSTPVTVETIRADARAYWNSCMNWFRKHRGNANGLPFAKQYLAQVDLCEETGIFDRAECGRMRNEVYDIYGAIIVC